MALDKAARFVGCVLRVTEAFVYFCDWRQILSLWSVIWASWGLALVPGTFAIPENIFRIVRLETLNVLPCPFQNPLQFLHSLPARFLLPIQALLQARWSALRPCFALY